MAFYVIDYEYTMYITGYASEHLIGCSIIFASITKHLSSSLAPLAKRPVEWVSCKEVDTERPAWKATAGHLLTEHTTALDRLLHLAIGLQSGWYGRACFARDGKLLANGTQPSRHENIKGHSCKDQASCHRPPCGLKGLVEVRRLSLLKPSVLKYCI